MGQQYRHLLLLLLPRVAVAGGLGAALDAFIEGVIPADEAAELANEGCRAVCVAGSVPVPLRPLQVHRPMANGCGPQSGSAREVGDGRYQVKEGFGLLPCCNAHDLCFQTCGLSHTQCESRFSSCLASSCNALPPGDAAACFVQANSFSTLTNKHGCSFHRESNLGGLTWNAHCECVPEAEAPARLQHYAGEFISEYGERNAWNAETLRDKLRGAAPADRGWVLFNLTIAYSDSRVDFVEQMEPHECVVSSHQH
jgi:hypothetical protein